VPRGKRRAKSCLKFEISKTTATGCERVVRDECEMSGGGGSGRVEIFEIEKLGKTES
jgi:hypothetical protein